MNAITRIRLTLLALSIFGATGSYLTFTRFDAVGFVASILKFALGTTTIFCASIIGSLSGAVVGRWLRGFPSSKDKQRRYTSASGEAGPGLALNG